MPKNPNVNRVLVIGSGPIVIGQAAEFGHYTAFRYQAEETRADFFRAHQCDISTQVYGPRGTLLYTLPGDGSIPNTEEEGIQWR